MLLKPFLKTIGRLIQAHYQCAHTDKWCAYLEILKKLAIWCSTVDRVIGRGEKRKKNKKKKNVRSGDFRVKRDLVRFDPFVWFQSQRSVLNIKKKLL